MKKYIAEGIGTLALTLVVGLSIKLAFPVGTPFLAALVLALFVYSIGGISGSHINPAVTLGIWSIGKIKTNEAVLYILSQFVGAIVAVLIISSIPGPAFVSVADDSWIIVIAELVGTFFFAFGIASAVYGKAPHGASGIVVGGSLLLGIIIAAMLGSAGILNPAVAFGVSSLSFSYALAPIVGSMLGMNTYKYLAH